MPKSTTISAVHTITEIWYILLRSGLAEKSVPEGFEDDFVRFYLSDETFLGRCLRLLLAEECENDQF